MKRDQFAGRYAIKLGSSIIVVLCNIVIQFLLPRTISVEEYGFYSYNLNVFTSVVVMTNLSTSSALVAKYSKKCEDIGYVWFYLKYFAIMALFLTIGLMGLFSLDEIRKSFGGQTLLVVLLGLESSILIKLMSDVISLYDAAAISRVPAFFQIIQRFALCLFVVGSYLLGRLDLIYFYMGQICTFAVVIGILIRAFFDDHKEFYREVVVRRTGDYIEEYYRFCRPLVIAGIVSQGIIIIMNYTLMRFSGVAEQAMFGAAWQLNTLVGYVFSPYVELMKREFAVISATQDALKYRFWQSLKTVMWLASYFAIFIAVFAEWLLPLFYGEKYSGAVMVTQMIMVYTIFQALGQLGGSYMIATEATKGYAVNSVISQVVLVICIPIFQVPNFIFNDGLGSTGIGLTYMCANYISVLVMMRYILKRINGSMFHIHLTYIMAIFSCGIVAYITRLITQSLFIGNEFAMNLIRIVVSGMIYSLAISAEMYMFPSLLGVERGTLNILIRKVILKWKRE